MCSERSRDTDRERETDKDTEKRNMGIGKSMSTATVGHSPLSSGCEVRLLSDLYLKIA